MKAAYIVWQEIKLLWVATRNVNFAQPTTLFMPTVVICLWQLAGRWHTLKTFAGRQFGTNPNPPRLKVCICLTIIITLCLFQSRVEAVRMMNCTKHGLSARGIPRVSRSSIEIWTETKCSQKYTFPSTLM